LSKIESLSDAYLEEYMIDEIKHGFLMSNDRVDEHVGGVSTLMLELFTTTIISSFTDKDDSIRIVFQSTAAFSEGSAEVPTMQELDRFLAEAFNGGFKVSYLELLHHLSANAVLSGVIDVRFDFANKESPNQNLFGEPVTSIPMSRYALDYMVIQAENLAVSDFYELQEVTNMYLRSYVMLEFGLSASLIDNFSTAVTGHLQNTDGSIKVEYESTISFKLRSAVAIPSVEKLDAVRIKAFSWKTLGDYMDLLESLQRSNAFATASFVRAEEGTLRFKELESTDNDSQSLHVAFIVAISVTTALFVAALFNGRLCCKKLRKECDVVHGKNYAVDTDGESQCSGSASCGDMEYPTRKASESEESLLNILPQGENPRRWIERLYHVATERTCIDENDDNGAGLLEAADTDGESQHNGSTSGGDVEQQGRIYFEQCKGTFEKTSKGGTYDVVSSSGCSEIESEIIFEDEPASRAQPKGKAISTDGQKRSVYWKARKTGIPHRRQAGEPEKYAPTSRVVLSKTGVCFFG
jgi:hypothetical protein